jgi:hypothetical protein
VTVTALTEIMGAQRYEIETVAGREMRASAETPYLCRLLMKTFAERVIAFNRSLRFTGSLPKGIRVMNPFREFPDVAKLSAAFYRTFYNDNHPRKLILGINPGRFGAGLTGIPFTDPKRLERICGIPYPGKPAHEPSSEFIYEMIAAYGTPAEFYRRFYINSICPLGFTALKANGREVNYNYYDSRELQDSVTKFIVRMMKNQIGLGVETDTVYCLGTGKNVAFLNKLNETHRFFGRIEPLEHPRYIMQYKSAFKKEYIWKYHHVLGC